MVYEPYMAGDVVTAASLNDATLKTLETIFLPGTGSLGVTSGTTELDYATLRLGPHAVKAAGIYAVELDIAATYSVATDVFMFRVRANGAAGTVVAGVDLFADFGTAKHMAHLYAEFVPASDATVEYYISVQRQSGTGTLTLSRSLYTGISFRRVGYAVDYTTA